MTVDREHDANASLQTQPLPGATVFARRRLHGSLGGRHRLSMAGGGIGRATAVCQGVFWLTTGLWPLVHYRSFEAVTGPKEDDWLVKTIGGLITVVGATLLLAGVRGRPSREISFLGAAAAATISIADVVFVKRGRISRTYLLDVVAEAPLLAGWAAAAVGSRTIPGGQRA